MAGWPRRRAKLTLHGKWPPPGHYYSMLNKDGTPKDPPNDAAVLFNEHDIEVPGKSRLKVGWRLVAEREWRQGRMDALRLRDAAMANRIEAKIMEIQSGRIVLGKGAGKKHTVQEIQEGFEAVFDLLGGIEGLAAYAAVNPKEFYQLYAKMLPRVEKAKTQRERGDDGRDLVEWEEQLKAAEEVRM